VKTLFKTTVTALSLTLTLFPALAGKVVTQCMVKETEAVKKPPPGSSPSILTHAVKGQAVTLDGTMTVNGKQIALVSDPMTGDYGYISRSNLICLPRDKHP